MKKRLPMILKQGLIDEKKAANDRQTRLIDEKRLPMILKQRLIDEKKGCQ